MVRSNILLCIVNYGVDAAGRSE